VVASREFATRYPARPNATIPIEALANAFACPVSALLHGTEDDRPETEAEINRRLETTSPEDFVDAWDVLIAANEARCSKAGRRRTVRLARK
jgi:hypothetical protein